MKSKAKGARRSAASAIAGVAALGLVMIGWPESGAGAAGQSGSQVREEVTVALKLLQAYVTTKDGKPVTDLTAADFEITDNGKKMPVTQFENHVVGGDNIAPGAPVEGPRLNRQFFFFFDFAFTDPRSARKAREAALHFMDTAIKPGDEVGVLSYSPMRGLTIHEYLTTDHARVRNVVDAFGLRSVAGRAETLTNLLYADELKHMQESGYPNPAGGAFQPGRGSSGSSDAAADVFFQEQARAQTAGVVDEGRRQGYTDQARQFAQTFANLARAMRYVPGWKNLILFSAGISRALIYGNRRGMDVPNMNAGNPDQMMAELNAYDAAQSNTGVRTEFSDALKELKNANSPIYAIDCTPTAGEMDINNPVGTSVSNRELTGKDSLIQLAGESGGKYFSNSMDYKSALAAVQDITSAFYVLGYSVPAAWDGAFHKIKVKVLRPGLKVVSQNGYYNPKPLQQYSRFERLLQMTDLALSDNPLTQLPADATMAVIPV
ncbi:MAG TPA: VWA domain-containing protein, partial [Acidobacteriota bacterium]|nr:VWA domain-containing protein [Acidobacteriota bacterium]